MLHADRNANGIIINMLQGKCRLGAIRHVIAPMPVSSALSSTMTGTDSVVSTAKSMVFVTVLPALSVASTVSVY